MFRHLATSIFLTKKHLSDSTSFRFDVFPYDVKLRSDYFLGCHSLQAAFLSEILSSNAEGSYIFIEKLVN
uniref:Uncharacterized protein n=1 Tax=Cannabis sativa TaxID=3483 RepID=A0A803QUX3_CANSA